MQKADEFHLCAPVGTLLFIELRNLGSRIIEFPLSSDVMIFAS
jgi:hypothetical protein